MRARIPNSKVLILHFATRSDLRYMRRGNVSVISADKHLVAGAVVIEKRRDRARRRIARREMGVDECGGRATSIRHRHRVAVGTR